MKKIVCLFIFMLFTTSIIVPSFRSEAIENELKNNKSCEYNPGSYLIDTEWGQHGLYKIKCPFDCPDDANDFCRLGCWSLAIGQIINYHSEYYNLQTQGFVDYTCTKKYPGNNSPIIIKNNLDNTDYAWYNMALKLIDSVSTTEEIDNVSQLLYDTATVIQKDFGTGAYCTISNTTDLSTLINELIEHFPAINAFTEWDTDLTESEIKTEIDYGRPIMFYTKGHDYTNVPIAPPSIFAHAMIMDGYRYNSSSGRSKFEVHLNYGWDGPDGLELSNTWYYYYGNFPTYDDDIVFDFTEYRKGLLIRLTPNPPSLTGPTKGVPEKMYNYSVLLKHAINPPFYYKVDWGDGMNTNWLGRYDVDEPCIVSHTWKIEGTYQIKAKVKDMYGESEWSEPLDVSMPKNKTIGAPFQRFLEQYPHVFPILRHLLGL